MRRNNQSINQAIECMLEKNESINQSTTQNVIKSRYIFKIHFQKKAHSHDRMTRSADARASSEVGTHLGIHAEKDGIQLVAAL